MVISLIELIRFELSRNLSNLLMVSIILLVFSYYFVCHHKRWAQIRFGMFHISRLIFFILLSTQFLCHASNNFNSLDFEKIKNQFFSPENVRNFSESKLRSDDELDRYNMMECMQELMKIGKSLQKLDFWAIKRKFNWKFKSKATVFSLKVKNFVFSLKIVLDSWGKFPSGIFSGNAYDFGAFSQCLNLERNGQHYSTQYCLATITFTMKDLLPKDVRTKIALLDENGGVVLPRAMLANK